jgi:hypothetical protein
VIDSSSDGARDATRRKPFHLRTRDTFALQRTHDSINEFSVHAT